MSGLSISEYFDAIFCINLRSRPDRWKESQLEFSKANLKEVIRFEAISEVPEQMINSTSLGFDPNDRHFRNKIKGHLGCLLSHREIIISAKNQNLKQILILEDDVQFIKDVNKCFEEQIAQVPMDWSLLYFGGNEMEIHRRKQVGKNVYTVSKMLMTHAVGIRRVAFDSLIQLLSECDKPVDIYYSMIQQIFPCFTFSPYLAWQRAGWSDITQHFRLYDFEYVIPSYRVNRKRDKPDNNRNDDQLFAKGNY